MKSQNRNWREIVERQEASAKSIQEYCKDIGVHPNTLYRKRKVQRRSTIAEMRPTPSTQIGALIVNVGKYSAAIRSGFNAAALKSVLEVLEELQ